MTRYATRNTVLVLVAIAFAIIYLFPLYWMYITAIKTSSEAFANPPIFIPTHAQWSNFVDVWVSRGMGGVRTKTWTGSMAQGRDYFDIRLGFAHQVIF